jgi:hypothetical protein
MHRPDTIRGVLEFCANEGQPANTLEEFLEEVAKWAENTNKIAIILPNELKYKSPY